ncbi:MAG: MATE family efflux transporter, partial [Pseudomonadota bacterium]
MSQQRVAEEPSGKAKFLTGAPMRHVVVMTSTASVGLMAIFAVDLVDMYFLSLLGEIELAAAVGFGGTVLFFTTSVCIGVAISMAALVSRRIGAGDKDGAKHAVTNVFVFGFVLTVPIAVLVWFTIPWMLGVLGADGRTAELAEAYLRIITPSMPFLAIGMACGGALRGIG